MPSFHLVVNCFLPAPPPWPSHQPPGLVGAPTESLQVSTKFKSLDMDRTPQQTTLKSSVDLESEALGRTDAKLSPLPVG